MELVQLYGPSPSCSNFKSRGILVQIISKCNVVQLAFGCNDIPFSMNTTFKSISVNFQLEFIRSTNVWLSFTCGKYFLSNALDIYFLCLTWLCWLFISMKIGNRHRTFCHWVSSKINSYFKRIFFCVPGFHETFFFSYFSVPGKWALSMAP